MRQGKRWPNKNEDLCQKSKFGIFRFPPEPFSKRKTNWSFKPLGLNKFSASGVVFLKNLIQYFIFRRNFSYFDNLLKISLKFIEKCLAVWNVLEFVALKRAGFGSSLKIKLVLLEFVGRVGCPLA